MKYSNISVSCLALALAACNPNNPQDAPQEALEAVWQTETAIQRTEEVSRTSHAAPCVPLNDGVSILVFGLNNAEKTVLLPTGEIYRFTGPRNIRLARLKPNCGNLFPRLETFPSGFRRYSQSQLLSDLESLQPSAEIWRDAGIDKSQLNKFPRERYSDFAASMRADPLGADL